MGIHNWKSLFRREDEFMRDIRYLYPIKAGGHAGDLSQRLCKDKGRA